MDDLADRLRRITHYPTEIKADRLRRFQAQIEAWHWYAGEGDRKKNPYLRTIGISKLLLFGGRLVLAHNERLYPYHKWFLAVLERAPHKPERFLEAMRELSEHSTFANATTFYTLVHDFWPWEMDLSLWPNCFMQDSELNWVDGTTPIDDI